jgi:hypothetical protein
MNLSQLVHAVGFEPTAYRLKGGCSTNRAPHALVPLPRLELGTEPSQGPVMIRFTTRAWCVWWDLNPRPAG